MKLAAVQGWWSTRTRQTGLTIVELLLSITLGMLVVLAATALFVASKSTYGAVDDGDNLEVTGRFALEMIARSVRQAAYVNWDNEDAPINVADRDVANIVGLDASSLGATSAGLESANSKAVNNSDVLGLRFFGVLDGQSKTKDTSKTNDPSITNDTSDGMQSMLHCGGDTVPQPDPSASPDEQRAWSIFYIANSSWNEPELRCKYRVFDKNNNASWNSDALLTGVESLQFLYGVDTDTLSDGIANQYMNADAVNALDKALTLVGATAEEKQADFNRQTFWKKIVAIKVAVLVRGTNANRTDALNKIFDLFGADYSAAKAQVDLGSRIDEATLPKASQNRQRKVFNATILLRNPSKGSIP